MEFQELIVGTKKVFICEEHHHVLKFWQQYKDLQPYLLTFDHHTDLHAPFQKELYNRNNQNEYQTQENYYSDRDKLSAEVAAGNFETIKKLAHDEHITTAIHSGIINKALVYAEDSFWRNGVYTINGEEDYAGQKIINNPRNHEDYNSVISTRALEQNFKRFDLCIPREQWLSNFILDIDLDVFLTTKAIRPADTTFFKMLVRKSLMISIAKESHWIGVWQRDHDAALTVDYLLDELFKLIREACQDPT